MDINELTERTIGCAYAVHNELGAGFLEKVYENALRIESGRAGLKVEQQKVIAVYYLGELVGDFVADMVIEGKVIVEVKAVREIVKEHEVQLVNYLAATGIDDGLLINFGESVQVKRKYRQYRKGREQTGQDLQD